MVHCGIALPLSNGKASSPMELAHQIDNSLLHGFLYHRLLLPHSHCGALRLYSYYTTLHYRSIQVLPRSWVDGPLPWPIQKEPQRKRDQKLQNHNANRAFFLGHILTPDDNRVSAQLSGRRCIQSDLNHPQPPPLLQ